MDKLIEINNYKEVLEHIGKYKTIVVIGFPNSGKTRTFKNVKSIEYVTFVYQGEGINITDVNKYQIPSGMNIIIDEIHSNVQEEKTKEIQKNNKVIIIHNRIFSDDAKRSVDAFKKVYHLLDFEDAIFFVKTC